MSRTVKEILRDMAKGHPPIPIGYQVCIDLEQGTMSTKILYNRDPAVYLKEVLDRVRKRNSAKEQDS